MHKPVPASKWEDDPKLAGSQRQTSASDKCQAPEVLVRARSWKQLFPGVTASLEHPQELLLMEATLIVAIRQPHQESGCQELLHVKPEASTRSFPIVRAQAPCSHHWPQ